MDSTKSKTGQASAPDSSWSLLFGAGAAAAMAYVIMILVPLVLMLVQPPAPMSGGAAILEYIAAHRAVYLAELLCFVGLSLPAIFVFLALGAALWHQARSLALLGAVVGVVSETIALALGSSPPSLNGGLLLLSGRYAATADQAARASLASAAEALAAYANAVSAAGILTALGILLLSVPLARAGFPKWNAVLGIVAGISGIVCEVFRDYIGAAYAVYGLLLPAWFMIAGLGLARLSRESRIAGETGP
jgi:hypothetical protein